MPYVRTIICLANSYKPGGRCVAGKEVLGRGKYGGWIRPVSSRSKAEVSLAECGYRDDAIPKPLDIIDMPLRDAAPANPQTENQVLDPKNWWVKRGEFSWDELDQLRDRPASLWMNGHRTRTGVNNCISSEDASTASNSLLLIKEKNFAVIVAPGYGTASSQEFIRESSATTAPGIA